MQRSIFNTVGIMLHERVWSVSLHIVTPKLRQINESQLRVLGEQKNSRHDKSKYLCMQQKHGIKLHQSNAVDNEWLQSEH